MVKKNVFITGGDKGIGKAIVEKFAKENYNVSFTYKTNKTGAQKIKEKYPDIEYYQCDITDYNCVKNIVKNYLKKNDYLDILINNAGITKDKTFKNMNKNDWDIVIDVNLKSIFNFTHEFLSHIRNDSGRIINISSVVGQKGAFGQTNYAASKAGIIGFTKSLSLELAKDNITVNSIAPGMIDTDMTRQIPKDYMDKIIQEIPLSRLGDAKEIAELIFYLSKDEAKYITGQVLNINGGYYL
jgi:NAD(P)-dependent dehydrogenase (short-subunit alcohol dehydrogenase family)